MQRMEERQNPLKKVERMRRLKWEKEAVDIQEELLNVDWGAHDTGEGLDYLNAFQDLSKEDIEELARIAKIMKNKRGNK